MGDRPIGFSPEMVKALLAGRKTMTRRLAWRLVKAATDEGADSRPSIWQKAKPGDRLWVRETWRPQTDDEIWMCVEYQADMARIKPYISNENQGGRFQSMCERAEASVPRPNHWKSSRYMPRWASRITLTVTAVKIERVQNISEADAIAEGWAKQPDRSTDPEVHRDAARDWYSDLWGSLHGAECWAANPEVVALSFTVHKDNIDHAVATPRGK